MNRNLITTAAVAAVALGVGLTIGSSSGGSTHAAPAACTQAIAQARQTASDTAAFATDAQQFLPLIQQAYKDGSAGIDPTADVVTPMKAIDSRIGLLTSKQQGVSTQFNLYAAGCR